MTKQTASNLGKKEMIQAAQRDISDVHSMIRIVTENEEHPLDSRKGGSSSNVRQDFTDTEKGSKRETII